MVIQLWNCRITLLYSRQNRIPMKEDDDNMSCMANNNLSTLRIKAGRSSKFRGNMGCRYCETDREPGTPGNMCRLNP